MGFLLEMMTTTCARAVTAAEPRATARRGPIRAFVFMVAS
jgi:hypothetical protein